MFRREMTAGGWLVGRLVAACVAGALCLGATGEATAQSTDPWIVLEGKAGPGKGKHVVLVSGDEEYRSEETLPALAKILAERHGFKCTVLFAIDPADGSIDPNKGNNIPGLAALDKADLAVFFLRFRNLPDDQMKHVVDYIESGRPIIGLRTATHAFNLAGESTYRKYTWNNGDKEYEGGFGRQVLGETWISHHGNHGSQSTRGIVAPGKEGHPILRGIKSGDVWGPTDVYGVRLPLPGDSDPLLLGEVLEGMKFEDKPIAGAKNEPRMPVAWVKTYKGSSGKTSRVFTTTMGASQDFSNEGMRRLLVNACYWAAGLEDKIPARSDVALVGRFEPLPFKFNGAAKGVKPADLLK
ncbi:MAG: ThuA domain-containing protein [Planctomycetaceae bacterium]